MRSRLIWNMIWSLCRLVSGSDGSRLPSSLVVIAYIGTCVWLKINEHRLVFTRDLPTEPLSESLGFQPQTVQIGTLGSVPVFAWSIQSLPNNSAANQWVLHFH